MERRLIATAAFALVALWAATASAVTDTQKCEAAKLLASAKYDLCRLKAERKAVLKVLPPDYTKCDSSYALKWSKAETSFGGACPSSGDQTAMQSFVTDHSDEVTTSVTTGSPLPDCPGDLTTCSGSLGTCNGSLTTCTSNLGTANASLTSCNATVATCNAGTAGLGDVLSGKTFSSSAGLGASGTMMNNGAVSITPSTSAQTVAAGYHNGSGTVAGDPDLVAGNIVSGVNLFGVAGTYVSVCGNGNIDGGENCDGTNLNGGTCVGQGFAGGTLGCGANCLYSTSGCYAQRFVDNGNGTISDYQTGLKWEKKSDDGTIHDWNNLYTWSATYPNPDGTAYTVFLATLNGGGGFATHTNWRLPTREELQGIVDYTDSSSPTVNAAFDTSCAASCTVTTCSCTVFGYYWSSSTLAVNSDTAWLVSFGGGNVNFGSKPSSYYVRAVRTGL